MNKKTVRKVFFSLLAAVSGVLAAVTGFSPSAYASAVPSGVPVMGYNSWYQSDTNVTQAGILQQAHDLVNTGLAAHGYTTVVLDDGWAASARTGNGSLTWNTSKFPNGLPWLSQQLSGMGLHLGIYEAIGDQTCARLPGSYGHYAQDAATFKSWGISFVKVDDCLGLPSGTTTAQLTSYFEQYGTSIRGDGMTYSQELPVLMPVGSPEYNQAVAVSPSFSNMWRVAPDEHWTDSASYTILSHLADDLHLHAYAGSGHWNDLDMLVPGVPASHPFDWTLAQEESQLSVWAQEASPLFLSTDISSLSAPELAALVNPDMLAIDQSGSQAPYSVPTGPVEAVVKGADGGVSVLFANLGTGTYTATFTTAQLRITGMKSAYNVWTGYTGSVGSTFNVQLGAGQTALYVFR